MTRDELLSLKAEYDQAAQSWQAKADQCQANALAASGGSQAIQDMLDRFFPLLLSDVLAGAGLKQDGEPEEVNHGV